MVTQLPPELLILHLPNTFLQKNHYHNNNKSNNNKNSCSRQQKTTNKKPAAICFFQPEFQYHFPWSLSRALRSKHCGPSNRHVETIVGTKIPACRHRNFDLLWKWLKQSKTYSSSGDWPNETKPRTKDRPRHRRFIGLSPLRFIQNVWKRVGTCYVDD